MLSFHSICLNGIEAAAALLFSDSDEEINDNEKEASQIVKLESSSHSNYNDNDHKHAFLVKEEVKRFYNSKRRKKEIKTYPKLSSDNHSTSQNPSILMKLIRNFHFDDHSKYFGLNLIQIEKLVSLLAPLYKLKDQPGKKTNLEMLVLAGLAVLASQRTYKELSSILGKHGGSVCVWGQKFNSLVAEHLCHLIKWPKIQLEEVQKGFQEVCGFPSVVGAFGSCDMHLRCTTGVGIPEFKNEKGLYSLVLSASCDHRFEFTSFSLDTPKNFQSTNGLSSEIIQSIFTSPESLIPCGSHIIAGRGLPLCDQILTPYLNNDYLTEKQMMYNEKLEKTRKRILKAFDLLKNRFQRLKSIDIVDYNRTSSMIMAACILHNLVYEDEEPDYDNIPTVKEHVIVLDTSEDLPCIKRDDVCSTLWNMSTG